MSEETGKRNNEATQAKRRSLLRFTVRSLLVLVALLAIVLAFPVRQALFRNRAMNAIQSRGGTVGAQVVCPKWLRPMVGDNGLDYFRDAARVSFRMADFGDEDLDEMVGHIKVFNKFYKLDLDGSGVTDHGLAHLKELPRLRVVRLNSTTISDTGLKHLAELPQLEEVELQGTKVSAHGVNELKKALPECMVTY